MSRVRQVIRQASIRRVVRRGVQLLGPALALASGIALAGVLIDRLIGPGLAWWIWIAGPLVIGALTALIATAIGRGGPLDAAVEVDHTLRLHDRLGSALALESRVADDPFAAVAVEDAEAAAAGVRVDAAIPVRFGNSWAAWPALALIAAAVGFFMPPLRLLGEDTGATDPASDPLVRNATSVIDEAIEQLAPATPEAGDAAPEETRDVGLSQQKLDELRRQLLRGEKSPAEAITDAAGMLNDEAERLRREAELAQREADAISQAIAEAAAKAESNEESSPIAEAMRAGDLATAAERIGSVAEQWDQMSESERHAVEEYLEQLAGELDRAAQQREQDAAQSADAQRERLQQQGLSEQDARSMQDQTDPEAIQRALQERGIDQETAQRLAQETARRNAERRAQERAAEEARRLSESTREMIPDLRKPPPPRDPRPGDDQPADDRQTPPQERDPFSQPTPPGQPPELDSSDPANRDPQSGDEGAKQPESRGQQQPGGAPDPNEGARERQEQGDQESGGGQSDASPGSQRPAQQPQSGQGQSPSQQQPNAPQGVEQGATQGEEGSSGNESAGQPSERPGGGAGSGREEQREGSQQTGEAGEGRQQNRPSGAGGMREQLDRIAEQRRQSDAQRERAESLRRQAEQMAENLSPQERERLQRWMESQANETGGRDAQGGEGRSARPGSSRPATPFDGTDDLNLPGTGPGRVAREFYGPGGVDRGERIVSDRPMEDLLREARESAAQAVEERVIPSRYDQLLQRYFDQAQRRARESAAPKDEAPKAPAPAAEDAAPKP